MSKFVLDAWALLALLQGEEPAAARVRQLLDEAQNQRLGLFVSVINLGEVYYRVGRLRGEDEAQEVLAEIHRLPLTVVPASDKRVLAAAAFKIHHVLSYADAFAAALAAELQAVLVTGDPELVRMEGSLQIERLCRNKRQG